MSEAERLAAHREERLVAFEQARRIIGNDVPANSPAWWLDGLVERITAALLRRPAPPPALRNLADALTEDILDTPDADLLAEEPPPARAELAKRLRDRATSLEDSDGMSSDTSRLLAEAANALEAP